MKASRCLLFLLVLGLTPVWADSFDLQKVQAQAAQGDGTAEYELGHAYHLGQGVPKNFAKAAEYYRQAAAQGNAKSMHNLGYMYLHGQGVPKNMALAASWYQKAAEKGLAPSQLQLGLSYYFGDMGLKQNYVAAAQWLTMAAVQKDFPIQSGAAANALGAINEHGLGKPVDGEKAVYWYTQGAEMGNARAMFNLGHLYQEGRVVKKNPMETYKWLKLASNREDVMAQHLLPEDIALHDFSAAEITEGNKLIKVYNAKHHAPANTAAAAPSIPTSAAPAATNTAPLAPAPASNPASAGH